MGIIDDVKDATRKVANTVVDKTENIAGIAKSPQELAKRIIEHLSHQEYKEVARMLSDEAKKYLNKVGLEDSKAAQEKLDDFENAVNALAIDLADHNYERIASQFEKLEEALPQEALVAYPLLGSIKNILKSIKDTFKKHIEDGTEPKFEDMLGTLEKAFGNFTNR